jgi:thiol-disulfide isomerase/thioredoxin
MNNKKRTILGLVMLVVLLLGAYLIYGAFGNQNNFTAADNQNQDKIMSIDFTVQDVDGNIIKLSEFYGQPIVLNFWASWCPPCKSEMPEFNQAYNELNGEVVFLMINQTDGNRETVEAGSSYVKDQGFTFPVYYDTKLEAAYIYNVTAIPTTYFIDKEGYIVSQVKGAMSKEILLSNIDKIK